MYTAVVTHMWLIRDTHLQNIEQTAINDSISQACQVTQVFLPACQLCFKILFYAKKLVLKFELKSILATIGGIQSLAQVAEQPYSGFKFSGYIYYVM